MKKAGGDVVDAICGHDVLAYLGHRPHLISVGDVDGFVCRGSKDTSLSERGQLLGAQQREQRPLADVHHGSHKTQPRFPGGRSQGWQGGGGRNGRGVTRRRGDFRRRIWCRRWWRARGRIIPADTFRQDETRGRCHHTEGHANKTSWSLKHKEAQHAVNLCCLCVKDQIPVMHLSEPQ